MIFMAGAEGFEPPKAVLETAGLPLAYAPTPFHPKSPAHGHNPAAEWLGTVFSIA